MKNLRIVFEMIRKYAVGAGAVNDDCFAALGKLAIANTMFFPLYSYLHVLYSLGYIKLSGRRRVIQLTKKGKAIPDIPYSAGVLFTLLLHILGRMVLLALLFILFWPVFLFMPKRANGPEEEKSVG